MYKLDNLAKNIFDSAITGLIDSSHESEEGLRPKLLYNNYRKGNTVLANLQKELQNCESFWFSVAFITKSGLIVLKDTLKELQEKGVKGRILTTDYLSFNEPDALRELLSFNNLDIRVFREEDFHTKGYMFQEDNKYIFVVGSSNLTQRALKSNKEWNIKITSLENGELIKETISEFELMWQKAVILDTAWIDEYEESYNENKKSREKQKIVRLKTYTLEPNKMQVAATRSLSQLRAEGKNKALLISATGTGKTYLSAFDVRNLKPKRLLFLVHREQILIQAVESFKDVLGENINIGILSGSKKEVKSDYLFSTIHMFSKEHVYKQFLEEYFDYIIIDETHKAGADSYLKILEYFKPKFLLGMTATPERTDGYDIYQLFDYNIAYEIRLQQAMEEDLLCPFHYFGISELTIDGKIIDDAAEFNKLVSLERVNNIIDKINFYGYSGKRVKGLIFCSRKEEAKELSKIFNEKGYNTIALSGEDNQAVREEAIERLEQEDRENGLDYIFTIDIFNEGVDIPSINQIIMLRPTQSSIIFVQQLGRGLRKAEDKEYVVVIDFIGSYQKNFLIPIALSGDRTYNKDTVRKYVLEGNKVIPGCSTINFDEVAKERIYESINNTKFSDLRFLKGEYINMKNKLGRIPSLMDFYNNGAVDPSIIIEYSKSYYNFLIKVEPDFKTRLNMEESKMLEFVSVLFSSGKRPHELLIIKMLMNKETINFAEITAELYERYGIVEDFNSINSSLAILKGGFISGSDKKNYSLCTFIENEKKDSNSIYKRYINYYNSMKNILFLNLLKDVVDYGLKVYEDTYADRYLNTNLSLYKKYSRKDVCRILNWESDESSVMYGYKIKYGTCPIFVTYNKGEDISGSTKYEDQFIDRSTFSWMTRSRLTLESNEVKQLLEHQENGIGIHLFVKKADGEGRDFYYLGKAEPILEEVRQITIEDDKGKLLPVVNIPMHIFTPVQEDVYDYLTH